MKTPTTRYIFTHMERLLVTIPPAIPMVALLGAGDANILAIEAAFPSVNITVRGNEITLRGPHVDCLALEKLFGEMLGGLQWN